VTRNAIYAENLPLTSGRNFFGYSTIHADTSGYLRYTSIMPRSRGGPGRATLGKLAVDLINVLVKRREAILRRRQYGGDQRFKRLAIAGFDCGD
jgi:hypothetical protein